MQQTSFDFELDSPGMSSRSIAITVSANHSHIYSTLNKIGIGGFYVYWFVLKSRYV